MNSKIKFKSIRRILSILMALMLSACMVFSVTSQVSAEATSNDAVKAVANGVFQIRMVYTLDNGSKICPQWGSSFLINENTVITAAHVVDIDDDTEEYLEENVGKAWNKKNISYEIVVRDDVTVPCTVTTESQINDFAVITLNKTINNRTVASIGDSDKLQKTQNVYSLGFPGNVHTDRNTYTMDDVTITASTIQNFVQTGTEDYIVHGSTLSEGCSGGPLVDEDGIVVGVNTRKVVGDDYYKAVNINQVKAVLSDLGIEYTPADNQASNEEETAAEEETTVAPGTTEAPATIAPASEAPSEDGNKNGSGNLDMTKLIIIIAIAVLVIILIVVVILLIVNSKKKSSAKVEAPVRGSTVMPGPQQQQMPSPNRPSQQPPYAQPYNRPSTPPQGSAPTMPSSEGAGETSVLNEGAGETTVLGNQQNGYVILRKRNNEKININKPEFVIGKERRRVDYCISDNNSISRTHAKIRVRSGKCYIADLGSTNCTYVNGSKLSPNQEVVLTKGDKIKISDEEFEFLG